MKTLLKVALGAALSVLTLWLFLRNLNFDEVWKGIAAANMPLLLLAIVVGYFGGLAVRSLRWRVMLEPLKARVSFYNLCSTTGIGYAVSWLAPGRLGEVVRPLLLARREGIPAAASVATVGLERIIDAVTIIALSALSALSAPLWWPRGTGPVLVKAPLLGEIEIVRLFALAGLAGLASCAAGVLIARSVLSEGSRLHLFLERRAEGATGKASRLIWNLARSLAAGASFLQDARRSAWVAVHSVILWTIVGISMWVGLLAAGAGAPLPGVFLLVALVAFGIAVPTPGGAGSVHVAYQWGLTKIFGIETNLAAAATVLYHPVMVYIPPVIFGLLFAWRDGLTLGGLRSLAGGNPQRGEVEGAKGGGAGTGSSGPAAGRAGASGADPVGTGEGAR